MAKRSDDNYVSIWFWLFALFVMAIPCVGFVMIFVWAFTGENESRKNYFRALIAWGVIVIFLWLGIMALGFSPLIVQQLHNWFPQWKQ